MDYVEVRCVYGIEVGDLDERGWKNGVDWNPTKTSGYFGRGRFFEGLLWKGKYKKNGYKYTGKDNNGSGLGINNYPIVDAYKGNKAVSIKTTKAQNPYQWKNGNASGNYYNQKHLDDIINGFDSGGFGTHPDLTGNKITKFDLDIYVEKLDYPQSEWQKMVDDYLDSKGAGSLKGKIKVNVSLIEDSI